MFKVKAFTLLELTIYILIYSILLTQFTYSTKHFIEKYNLDLATNKILLALDYCKTLAFSTKSKVAFKCKKRNDYSKRGSYSTCNINTLDTKENLLTTKQIIIINHDITYKLFGQNNKVLANTQNKLSIKHPNPSYEINFNKYGECINNGTLWICSKKLCRKIVLNSAGAVLIKPDFYS